MNNPEAKRRGQLLSSYEHKSQERRSRMSERSDNQVVVTDIKMSFMSMVIFMVKWVIASIPALIILAILGAIIMAIIMAILEAIAGPRW